jgi:hypothetical protein
MVRCRVDSESARKARSAARAGWRFTSYRLGEQPECDLSSTTTASERVAMVWRLTQDAWAMMNAPIPDYDRAQIPGRVIRKHDRP